MGSISEKYGSLVAHHPFITLLMVVIITLGAIRGASSIEMEPTRFTDFFPQDLDIIKTFQLVEDEFIGSRSMLIVLELDEESGRAALMDMRDPLIARYLDQLAEKVKDVEMVKDADTLADVIKGANGGRIPSSKRAIEDIVRDAPMASRYITSDYSMAVVRISLGDFEGREVELMREMKSILETTTPPPGIKAGATGDPAVAVVFQEATGPDMARTTRYSFVGILIIAISIFSLRHGIIPLVSIGVGLFWAFGLMGILGINISSSMAGFASMVMGIGIDFAIQVVNRYREEMGISNGGRNVEPADALTKTLSSVIRPMSTTALAALIGFRAMSLGELTMMQELGNVMSLGVLTSMIAAVTLVPSLLMIIEKI